MSSQYDVSDEVQKLYCIKQQKKLEAKAYFMRYVTNPHRAYEDGQPFDPLLFRYNAMSAYQFEHFKPTPKTIFYGLAFAVIPIFGLSYLLNMSWVTRESKIRNGEIAYKDRWLKLVM